MYNWWTYIPISDQSQLMVEGSNDSDIIQINEETILNALEASNVHLFEIDYTNPVTIEIGATDRPHQDNSVILGKCFIMYKARKGNTIGTQKMFVWALHIRF